MLSRSTPVRALGIALAVVLATGGMAAETSASPALGADAPPRPKVDLVFAIDTTGSMGPYIAAVQASARAITDLLFSTADARVALVDYKDLHQDCPSDGYAARVDLPFTADAADFGPSVDGLGATGGCDTPESVYSGIMTGLELPWRADARRALLLMGDAPPHDPEPVTGHTHASVTAAAGAGGVVVVPKFPATRSMGVLAAGSGPSVALYTVNIGGGGGTAFGRLAADTKGETYLASDPTSAVEQIAEAITDITAGGLVADAGGPYAGAVGEPVTFTATTTGGIGAVTSYAWDFDDNGSVDATSAVPTISHVYLKPFTGRIGLRVSTDDEPPVTAADTADIRILTRLRVKYTGQRSGLSGQRARLQAYVSGPKNTKLVGVPVAFTLGSATCTAPTRATGQAACEVVIPAARGRLPITARADAGPSRLPGETAEGFVVKEPRRRSGPPAPTSTADPTSARS